MSGAQEPSFIDAVRTMTDAELTRKRRSYRGRTDSTSLRHARAVRDELARRRQARAAIVDLVVDPCAH